MSFAEMMPFELAPEFVILLLAGLSALVTVLAVWNALLVRDPLGARLKVLAERRSQLKAEATAARERTSRQIKGVSTMRQVVTGLNLMRSRQANKIQMKLARAGVRSTDGPVVFMFLKALLPVAFGVGAAVLLYVVKIVELDTMVKLAIVLGAAAFGFYAPDLYLKNAADKRQKLIRKALPDTLDLLVICAEAGLGLDAALSRVTREMGKSSPEIADEFSLTSIELSFLPERRQALQNLNERTNMPEIRGVVNTLLQTEKYGTPLAQSLRVLSAEYRNNRLIKAEEKAARLPAILTVPMIVFILPCLFVVLLGPAILRTIDALSQL